MKNKNLIYLIFLIIFFQNILNANDFIIESSELSILEKGNITKATNGVKIVSKDGIQISANELFYNKEKSILKISGNVRINDKINNILSIGEEYVYLKNEEKIISKGETETIIQNNYIIESEDLIYNRNLLKVYSEKKSKLKDNRNNTFFSEKFILDIKNNILRAKKLSLYDNLKNEYFLEFAVVDLKENNFLGSNISIDFEDSMFGNKKNDPRLNANSLVSEEDETRVLKGNFTTCNSEENDCPPWSIHAEEVVHKKKQKIIEYKNAWLKIYDKPVLYFPYFFHPDPTVKRQTGFLMPSFQNSNTSGTSIQIPFYNVISDRKDITFFPRIFFDNEILLQTEYRQANKNSNLILDFSINKDGSNTKKHFFADLNSSNENKNLDFHIESVSNDSYLKEHNIKSSILNDNSTLYSYINYNSFSDESSLNLNFEIYEDLNKNKTDRYEYVFPNFDYQKNLYNNNNLNGDLIFNSRGFNKNYDTNTIETVLINDLTFSSFPKINNKWNGLQTNYKLLLRNLNSNAENSNEFKENENQELLSTFIFETDLPLKKESKNFNSFLTPKMSFRYSPNTTKNNSNLNKKLTYESIYSLDRIDDTAVEGGESATLGIEYLSRNKIDEDYLKFSLANIVRFNENKDLPIIHGLADKRSDVIGNIGFMPSKFFDINYQFSLNKNLSSSNYNLIKTNINVNNFITSFEFLEEDNILNDISYLKNTTKYKFDEKNSFTFATTKNLDQNITNYYNLIYEYENDCLTAAIEYNKSYYSDGSLRPEESLFFSIRIVPFGSINTPSIAK